ncbi:hypothetical protein [Burkholderia sp. LMG 13014]|uniref:hypothetical protein n=1 Tax=Burkholderia sp. LMG 13014 TaxID=2709306 RepID=UPI001965B190|nr:hypothetical protein [Burkholderia sp. LMG 13014]
MQTKVITYNLRERGRQFRGKERNFNIRAICDAINGPACQERVKNRDMLGYYGHWTRIKFGMNPAEGGLDDGRPSLVEPALVTTMLRASPDGTIEHQAEFLNNDPGQVAAKLYAGRVGGFSSAIDQHRPEFFGFDYVLEPNYSTNRGYTLDDVRDMTLDDIEAAIYDEQLRGVLRLLDSANAERDTASEVIEHLRAENEQLLSMLAAKGIDAGAAMDAVAVAPIAVSIDPVERMRRDAAAFRGAASLPQFVEPQSNADPAEHVPLYGRLLGQFLRR